MVEGLKIKRDGVISNGGRREEGIRTSMHISSNLTPWPWPSRFSKAVQMEVMTPPMVRIVVSYENAASGETMLETYLPRDSHHPRSKRRWF